MTLDKETLIKHRFWISLGVFVLLWLVGVILVPTVQGSINAALQDKFVKSKQGLEGIKDPKTDKFLEPLKEKEAELKKQKNKVWEEAWKPQSRIYTWPEGGSAHLEKLNGAYFGSFIKLNDRSEYGSTLYKQYLESLHFPDGIRPAEFNGGWKQVLRPVEQWDPDKPPTIEECWLAQEDLWVKRELLNVIRETLDSIRIFKDYKPEPTEAKESKTEGPPPAGAKSHLMRNANWVMNLILEPDPKNSGMMISAKSTFTNVNPWKRTLSLADVHFRIRQGEGNYLDFSVPVDRVAGNETTEFKVPIPFGRFRANPDKPFEAEQVLNWQASPIKRIDAIELGYNSHRTANRTCKAKPISKQAAEEETKDKQDNPAAEGGMLGSGSGKMTGSAPPPGIGAGPVGGKTVDKAVNRQRYLDFTEQVRWMPVGLVLVVDQEYLQDVQAAVANSRLRIQPTQISFHRVYGIRSTGSGGPSTGPERRDRPTGPEIGEGILGGGSSRYRQMTTSSPGPPIPGSGGAGRSPVSPGTGAGAYGPGVSAPSAGNEDDPNLVELSIYGIASLYERYPPKQPAAAPAPPKP